MTRPARPTGRPWADNQLLRGSVNLVANNASATGLGFLSWVVTTRLFTVGDVGSAAATIGLASLLANLAFLGAPGTLLRFLPSSEDQAALVRTALSVTLAAAVAAALVGWALQGPQAGVPAHSLLASTVFVAFVVALVAKAVAEATTIATRASQVAVRATVVGNVAKLAVLAVLGAVAAGSLGIVGAQVVAVLASLLVLTVHLRATDLLRGGWRLDGRVLRRVGGYAGSSYVNAVVGGLPLLLLPLLVRTRLGETSAGFWYVASLIATAMTLVSSGVGQSLLVEASHDTEALRPLAWRAFRWLMAVSAPMALVAVVSAPWLLAVFGHGYATGSLSAFRVLAVSTLFSPVVYVLGTVFFVRRRLAPLVAGNAANAAVVLLLAARASGIDGVAWAWMAGEVVYVVLFLVSLRVFPALDPRADRAGSAAGP